MEPFWFANWRFEENKGLLQSLIPWDQGIPSGWVRVPEYVPLVSGFRGKGSEGGGGDGRGEEVPERHLGKSWLREGSMFIGFTDSLGEDPDSRFFPPLAIDKDFTR